MPKQPKTIEGEFKAGMESGKHPNAQNTSKAIGACARKTTEPLIRAYWTGYLCQAHLDNPNFFSAGETGSAAPHGTVRAS